MDIHYDPAKNQLNRQKHGIDLTDVEGVFYDPFAITLEDRDHNEERFVTIGMDGYGRLLVVFYYYTDAYCIQLTSARLADPSERRVYGE